MTLKVIYTDEENLIDNCRKNNRVAQYKLYQQFAGKLMAVCRRYVVDTMEAEDILSKSFVKIFTHLHQYTGEGNFEGWMKRIVIHEALTYLRKKNFLHVEYEHTNDSALHTHIDIDLDKALILKMIQELPEGYRMVFNLYALDGYTHTEIAEKLNISENTSKSQLSRARKWLQQKIQSEQPQTKRV